MRMIRPRKPAKVYQQSQHEEAIHEEGRKLAMWILGGALIVAGLMAQSKYWPLGTLLFVLCANKWTVYGVTVLCAHYKGCRNRKIDKALKWSVDVAWIGVESLIGSCFLVFFSPLFNGVEACELLIFGVASILFGLQYMCYEVYRVVYP